MDCVTGNSTGGQGRRLNPDPLQQLGPAYVYDPDIRRTVGADIRTH